MTRTATRTTTVMMTGREIRRRGGAGAAGLGQLGGDPGELGVALGGELASADTYVLLGLGDALGLGLGLTI